MIEAMMNVVDQLADLVWAGRLGTRAVAGLGVAQTYVQVAGSARMGLDTAMRALVARAVGAGDIARANHVALQAFTLSGAFSILMAAIGFFFTEPLLNLLGVPAEVVDEGADYMRVQFMGTGSMAFRMMSGAALQASGDTFTPMRATFVTRVIHITFSPVLVFGWLFFPEMGLVGAAVAGIVSQVAGAIMNFAALFRGTSRLHLTLRGYHPDFPLLLQLVKTGSPAAITNAERAIGQLLLVGFVSPYGETTLAAFSLTRRIEFLAMMGGMGLGNASGVMVGQNLGAGRPDRARKSVAWAAMFVLAINVVVVSLMMIFPRAFLGIFNDDPALLDAAVPWLRIQAIGYFVLGLGAVFMQSYNTAGDTLIPMITVLFSYWIVQQPLAIFLPDLGLDELGIAWAIMIGTASRLLIFVPYYFTDRWLRISFDTQRRH
jgi:putative MATE family efflux protein